MLSISPSVIAEKNKIVNDGVWILLLDLISPDNSIHLRLARNTEDIIHNGETYQAFPFDLPTIPEDSNGRVSSAEIRVSNIDRLVQSYIEQDSNFCSGWDVKLSLMCTNITEQSDIDTLDELSYTFKIKNVNCNKDYVSFSLGLPNPMRLQTPFQKYSTTSCQRVFNQGGCYYSQYGVGGHTSCTGTVEQCKERFSANLTINGNKVGYPFNGKLGMTQNAIYQ